MDLLYKMFVDGTPLSDEQITSLIAAGMVVREGYQLKPASGRGEMKAVRHNATIDDLTRPM